VIRDGRDGVSMTEMSLHRRSPEPSTELTRLAYEDLMGLVRENDSAAFEVVYERHADAAFSLAYRMCGKRAAAEDVVQEAFLSLWRGGGRYDRERGSVRNWVLGIVRNRAIDALRRGTVRDGRHLSDEGIAEQLQEPELTDQLVGSRERAREIRAALGELPREQSRVIELAYYGGFTHTEIAAMLGIPVGTIKGRMRLGLQKLRSTLRSTRVAL
jgi:RNA polymerase sigma-70 factor (ECF subfamily)